MESFERQKRVIVVEDLSCVGKCSLTVALPIISAAGVETSVLPTAVLSTHTGGFTGYTFRDLTEDIAPIAAHWRSLNLHTDGIYTGYLGSFEQIDLVKQLIDDFAGEDCEVIVDPAMADNGVLYPAFDMDFVAGMRSLCEKADCVVPNLTEASFLLGHTYKERYSQPEIEALLEELTAMGPRLAVLTGVSFEEGKLGAASYDREAGVFSYYFSEHIDGYYHGTGDVFASAFTAARLRGCSPSECLQLAVDFTVDSIRRTKIAGTENRYGVDFENGLAEFGYRFCS